MEFSIIFFEPFPNSIINNFYPLLWTGVIPFWNSQDMAYLF